MGMFRRAATLLFLLFPLSVGCKAKAPLAPEPPATPEQCLAQLQTAEAKGQWWLVFSLLDRESRWSLMSVYKARAEECRLVRAHYPEHRRGRELARCQAVAAHKDTRTYFVAGGARMAPLGELARLGKVAGRTGSGDQITLTAGGTPLPFCRDHGEWGFCGLRQQYKQLKVKAARDLAVVRESAEASAGVR